MMENFVNNHIQEMPLSSPFFRRKVESFLRANGLRMEGLEVYYTIQDSSGEILAGAGLEADIVKCVAVSAEARSMGLVAPLISHIISEQGARNLKVFTKPENESVFGSLGFHTIARAPLAILMENGHGLETYCDYLRHARATAGISGVIVMNANPFTLGHKYLIDKALEQVDHLFIIPVKEDRSAFPYAERLAMLRAGVSPTHADAADVISSEAEGGVEKSHVTVLEGSSYVISAATFPTYFLKDLSDAAETQMLLDLDLFSKHIMPALGATMRFVGSEPQDALTARYNTLMLERIPGTVIVPRCALPVMPGSDSSVMPGPDRASAQPSAEENYFSGRCPKNHFSPAVTSPTHADAADVISSEAEGGVEKSHIISASNVRKAVSEGRFREAASMCPESTWPYLLAALAERALLLELDTPMKPGLVGPDGPGAHKDMDYSTMRRGIAALRPFWSRMVMASSAQELRQAGIEAETAMMAATGGVNTHRGAIFCLGLALNAMGAWRQNVDTEQFMQKRLLVIAHPLLCSQLTDSTLAPRNASESRPAGIKDARAMALDGYSVLFTDWLPFFMEEHDTLSSALLRNQPGSPEISNLRGGSVRANAPERVSCSSLQKTLLRIMSTLDDTCVIKRVGAERAQQVKREAAEALQERITLNNMCLQYAREGISPGGAADMLALTIFINSII